ncbi:MAG: regulatory protein RecX [Candidatus Roizmanbacteria bacterium]
MSESPIPHLAYALALLARRGYSTATMKRKIHMRHLRLSKKLPHIYPLDAVDDQVSKTLTYLSEHKLLDDTAYTSHLISSLRQRHKSDMWIRQKLAQNGISRDTVSELLTDEDPHESISHLIAHKLSYHPDTLTDKKKKEKLIRWLMGKGFRYGDIQKSLQS